MGGFAVNVVVLGGYLAADPEPKDLPSGETMARFRLGLNNSDEEAPICLNVVTFGKQAEACAGHLAKGHSVVVEGRLQQNQWQTSQGEKKSALEVKAHRVTFAPKAGQSSKGAG